MSIPKHFVEQVKDAIRMSELVGKFVALKRAGREFEGLCPFHQEKSPSFKVNDEKGFYHCFGCQAHGDALGFMIQYEKMNYVEAVKYLAGLVGMDVPEDTPAEQEQQDARGRVLQACELACSWFEQQLMSNAGMEARSYIRERAIHPTIQQQFRLGYAPNMRSGLKQFLNQKGFDDRVLFDAGLIVKPDSGEAYDRFRGRLMFPIFHKRGQVVAFGGRLLENNQASKAPKYLNSSETLVFKKRDMLYHLFEAAKEARNSKRILVVEGYMDVIACEQHGLKDAVATLGTAFTEDHLRTLWSQVDEPVICLDGDSAGSRAMLRSAELALPHLHPGKSLKFAILPKGDDPDSLLKRQGRQALEAVISHAVGLHEALFQAASQHTDFTDPSQRAALEKKLESLSAAIQEPTTRGHFKNYFREALWKSGKASTKPGTFKKPTNKGSKTERVMVEPASATDRLERSIFKFLLTSPALLHEAEAETALSHMHCSFEPLEVLRELLLHMVHEHTPIEQLPDLLAHAELSAIADALMQDKSLLMPKIDPEDIPAAKETLGQWLFHYDTLGLEAEYDQLSKALQGNSLDDAAMARLMMLQQEIQGRKLSS